MATIGEGLEESSSLIERGEYVFPSLEKLVQAKVPLFLKQAPYRKDEFYFLEITVSDPERSFVFYKRICRSSKVRELKEMLFLRYAIPPSEQAWVFNEKVLADDKKLHEVGMDQMALFCPVHVRVFHKLTWPSGKAETNTDGAWICGRCKMQNWEPGSECSNCVRQKEGSSSRPRDRRSRQHDLSDQPRDFMSQRSQEDLKEEGDVQIHDMSTSLVQKIGWHCPQCTMLNNPTRPGCEICATPRPANYRPPTPRALESARQNTLTMPAADSAPRPPKPAKPTWSCAVCDNVNPLSCGSCRRCTADRHNSLEPPKAAKRTPERDASVQMRKTNSATQEHFPDSHDYEDSLGPEKLEPSPEEEARARIIRNLIKESFGWHCTACGQTNEPNEQRCVECSSKRPFNYKVPTERERQALIASIPPEQLEARPPTPPPPPQRSTSNDAPNGWTCPLCSFKNRPRRPGCEMCGGEPPDDYDISQAAYDPQEEARLQQQRQNERAFIEKETERHQIELKKMEDAMNSSIVQPDSDFECPVCMCDIELADGIRLRNCLHDTCRNCLIGLVQADETGDTRCPDCGAQVDDRDIKNVVPSEVWEKRNNMLIRQCESAIVNSFHCLTNDCKFFVEIVDDINAFECGVCKKKNCITCKAQHDDETCEQYQERLKIEARNDENARLTLEMFERLIAQGEAMRCPQCDIVLQKKEGCDWLRCTGCRTEICWATKNFRWGPKGKGDTSGGCRCRMNSKPCVPHCRNCH